MQHSITLVLGGVRSGKSRYAQSLAELATRTAFIATAQRRGDPEMHAKIERHRAQRPAHWLTIEEPLRMAGALRQAAIGSDLILLDCLTLYIANLLEAHPEDSIALERETAQLCAALRSVPCHVVLVSNEVGSGVVPAFASGRRFRDLLGELNQAVAAIADRVVLMVAGLPLSLKPAVNAEAAG